MRMDDDIKKRVEEIQLSEVFKRVKELQASMVESAKSCFDESELGHLRCLIRLAVEFHDYLENGSVEIATGVLHGPLAKYVPDAQSASTDPFNKYDLEFACGSIRSGVDSFCILSRGYRMLNGATKSMVEWGMTSSRESFKTQFVSMFNKFTEEVKFENKCRLLLDLFKLQIVFAGISYDD
jgi:hypothetical protein